MNCIPWYWLFRQINSERINTHTRPVPKLNLILFDPIEKCEKMKAVNWKKKKECGTGVNNKFLVYFANSLTNWLGLALVFIFEWNCASQIFKIQDCEYKDGCLTKSLFYHQIMVSTPYESLFLSDVDITPQILSTCRSTKCYKLEAQNATNF